MTRVPRKAVIPAAGLGTRLLPTTKELPKEMLPIFVKSRKGETLLKPMLQAVFEQLYDSGIREFCFIVGRGKRTIEDHFTPDRNFMNFLKGRGKPSLIDELTRFYRKVSTSTIVFMNQPEPRGFGNAVSIAKSFSGNEPFLLQAGDDLILSRGNSHIKKLFEAFVRYDADAIFLIEEVENPRAYGVVKGIEAEPSIFKLEDIVEKPQEPPSKLAVVGVYIFKPIIYRAIKNTEADKGGEVQLTDALRLLIKWGCRLYALKLESDEKRIDIGTPEAYLRLLKMMPLTATER